MIPGLIKPLVWSVAIPTHSAIWLQILQDMIGENNINLSDMIRAFKYRAYFNVSVFGEVFQRLGMPQESLEMMMGLVPPNIDKPQFKPSPGIASNIPRMTSFLWNYAHFDRIAKQALPEIEKHCYSIPLEVLPQLDEKQILEKLDELHGLYRQISHHTIIVQMMMHILQSHSEITP